MPSPERIKYLFDRYLKKECTPSELEELVNSLQDDKTEEVISPRLHRLWEQIKKDEAEGLLADYHKEGGWQQIYERIKQQTKPGLKTRKPDPKMIWLCSVAAAILILFGGNWMLRYDNRGRHTPMNIEVGHQERDIAPGSNKAVLTLANGARISLGRVDSGTVAHQGRVQVIKVGSGMLAYRPASAEGYQKMQYNTLTTPLGGKYEVTLSDDTKVWLNAGSSLRYPTTFSGEEREVEITGEAYFEVSKNSGHPFIVTANGLKVKVLGTQFNIKAYAGEMPIKTTLVSGSVKVLSTSGASVILSAGQQAESGEDTEIRLIKDADIDEALGWKNGLFVFHQDKLKEVMLRLSRWYDVEVEYKGSHPPLRHFTGTIRRQENISKVLEMLELTGGAHFEIDGRKIIVSP